MSNDNELGTVNGPKWLDEKYLLRIISAENPKTVVTGIKMFSIKPATTPGQNYASVLYLVDIEYTTSVMEPNESLKLSFIVKTRLQNELMTAIQQEFNIFSREAQVYTKILPKAEEMLDSVGQYVQFGPRAFYVDEKIIVQDNLKQLGYAMEDVRKGLDLDQCKLVLQKLAKFHACSMILHRKHPELFVHHLPGNLNETPTPLHDMYINTMKSCTDYCKTRSELVHFVPKLEAFGDEIISKVINVFSRSPDDRIQALNHGDCWVNNFMFRKGYDHKWEDVLMLDYQEGYFGSIGIDLNFFFYSSVRKDVYVPYKETLIKTYHEELSDALFQLKYEHQIPTIEDVKQEIKSKSAHGITTATCLLPILINERLDLSDPLNFIESTLEAKANRAIILNNPNYLEHLQLFLTDFADAGLL